MTIRRIMNGKDVTIILTDEEIYAAHKEFVANWMINTAKEIDPSISDEGAVTVGIRAYDIYSEGNGETEYESVEKAVAEYNRKMDA